MIECKLNCFGEEENRIEYPGEAVLDYENGLS